VTRAVVLSAVRTPVGRYGGGLASVHPTYEHREGQSQMAGWRTHVSGRSLRTDGKEVPGPGNAFQVVLAAIFELDA